VNKDMRDPVPAIIEAAATGEIAEIFGDIRRVLGVDVVNLIWRHLATIDGALAWTWKTLRPVYEDGTIATEAAALLADLDLPALPGIPAEAFVALGLRGDDISAIRDVLAAYDRTNAMALIAFSSLPSLLGEEPSLPAAIPPLDNVIRENQQPRISLPRLLSLADLPTETAALIMTLNRLGTRQPGAVVASMYLHLSHWPAYLALVWAIIAPLDADGRLERSIVETRARAGVRAVRVVSRLRTAFTAPPDRELGLAIRAAVEPFAGDVLAKMVVICALLRSTSDGT
jgi:hypothetical protein